MRKNCLALSRRRRIDLAANHIKCDILFVRKTVFVIRFDPRLRCTQVAQWRGAAHTNQQENRIKPYTSSLNYNKYIFRFTKCQSATVSLSLTLSLGVFSASKTISNFTPHPIGNVRCHNKNVNMNSTTSIAYTHTWAHFSVCFIGHHPSCLHVRLPDSLRPRFHFETR